ncbi:unnamed protein product [Amoebophrya sp. A25]|nr:unnamed protein product [Amoebophrya sp. A25]|eukprot:GSA25T00004300001.1
MLLRQCECQACSSMARGFFGGAVGRAGTGFVFFLVLLFVIGLVTAVFFLVGAVHRIGTHYVRIKQVESLSREYRVQDLSGTDYEKILAFHNSGYRGMLEIGRRRSPPRIASPLRTPLNLYPSFVHRASQHEATQRRANDDLRYFGGVLNE